MTKSEKPSWLKDQDSSPLISGTSDAGIITRLVDIRTQEELRAYIAQILWMRLAGYMTDGDSSFCLRAASLLQKSLATEAEHSNVAKNDEVGAAMKTQAAAKELAAKFDKMEVLRFNRAKELVSVKEK